MPHMADYRLTEKEKTLVTDAGFIHTKNKIIQKVYELFGELSDEYRNSTVKLDKELLTISPKISKGENYLGLPWVMLDYPRIFSKTDVFAIRTFFWWGNFFSITLQLQGKYQQQYLKNLLAAPGIKDWMVCTDVSSVWQHNFENYTSANIIKEGGIFSSVKLAKKIPLEEWDNAIEFYKNSFIEICTALSSQPVE